MGTQRLLAVLCAACLGLVGCHESADTSVTNSAQVPATGGGTRQIVLPPTGDVALTLTDGALAVDTTVTLEVIDRPVPADIGIVSQVVRIGPTGTQLRHAATLSFANFAARLPAGTDPAALALAFLRDDGLLEGIQSGPFFATIVGSIDHFGDVVLIELQPRTVDIAVTRDPLLGDALHTLSIAVGSQVAGAVYPVATTVDLETDLGALSAAAVTPGSTPASVTLAAVADGTATVTATVAGTAITNFAQVRLRLPIVHVVTSEGDFDLALFPADAPGHVANFLTYANEGFYDGTIIHRVPPNNFVIQGGGFAPGMVRKPPTHDPIATEVDNGLSNLRGTLSLALTGSDANSGTSQFFINVGDNSFLDAPNVPGFTVFGEVVAGMGVVDAIAQVATHTVVDDQGTSHDDVPVTDVVVQEMVQE
jgi:peptidyl-prolyl cis-trans isomerase A (cyclophilin A)